MKGDQSSSMSFGIASCSEARGKRVDFFSTSRFPFYGQVLPETAPGRVELPSHGADRFVACAN